MLEVDIQKKLTSANGVLNMNLQFTCQANEFLVLSGVSGAGKTSILRMIAGLMKPDQGSIVYGSETWFDQGINLSPQRRNLGLVFQDYSLFPNMSVEQNIRYAKPKKTPESEITSLLETLELNGLRNQKPAQLSGGQKQRVAIARTLIQKPALLLLDEPLASVDPGMRVKLQGFIQRIHQDFQLSTIMVTHDISEAIRLADRIIQIDEGKIIKLGTPTEVFGHHELSGKFQFTGTVLEILNDDLIQIASVLVGNQLIKVVISDSESQEIKAGDEVLVASKAFNPIIKKL